MLSSFTSLLLRDVKARHLHKPNVGRLSTILSTYRMCTISMHSVHMLHALQQFVVRTEELGMRACDVRMSN